MLLIRTQYWYHAYFWDTLHKEKLPNIPKYIYDTQHPDETAHGGTVIIVKFTIKHHKNEKFNQEYLQTTCITVEEWTGPIKIATIYSPPKHIIKQEQYSNFFKILGNRFIVGGDYNAKHLWWGSRSPMPTPKGRQLYYAMIENNLHPVTTREPTYWPTNQRKNPDVIDFCIVKGISDRYFKAESCFDLSSDHSPIIVTLNAAIIKKEKPSTLYNAKTNWYYFREILNEEINCKIPLKNHKDIETVIDTLNKTMQKAAWKSTPTDQDK